MVLRPEEEARDEGATDALVPCRWVGGEGSVVPPVADVGDVVRVECGERRGKVCRGGGVQVDVRDVGAWRSVDLARAAEAAGVGGVSAHRKLAQIYYSVVAPKRLCTTVPKSTSHLTSHPRRNWLLWHCFVAHVCGVAGLGSDCGRS